MTDSEQIQRRAIDAIAVHLGGTVTQHMNAVRILAALDVAGLAVVDRNPNAAATACQHSFWCRLRWRHCLSCSC